MSVLLFGAFNGCSSSIKEINRLLWKGMSNIYYWEKLAFSKCTTLKSKKVQSIFMATFILALSSSAIFRLQNRVSDFF